MERCGKAEMLDDRRYAFAGVLAEGSRRGIVEVVEG